MNELMNRIRGVCSKLRLIPKAITREGKGQSLIVVVFALLGLLAFTGLAVDLGLVYSERVRIGRACDAAALAGVRELPMEYTAATRALEYMALNGYDMANARVEIHYNGNITILPEDDPPSEDEAQTIIKVYTTPYEDPPGTDNSANRLRVEGIQKVSMNFMQFFGFDSVPVSGDALAENVSNLDIAIVFDKSGSMEFDTLCYGCWEPVSGKNYPIGDRAYLPFPYDYFDYDPGGDWPPDDGFCAEPDYYRRQYSGNWYKYIVIEAEYYSFNHSIWDRDYAVKGIAHWTLQRNTEADSYDYTGSVGSSSVDEYGGYMMATPYYYSTYEEGATDPSGEHGVTGVTPRLEYDFHTPSGSGTEGGPGNYYIYLRAQGGQNPNDYDEDVDPRTVYWAVMDGSTAVDADTETVSRYSQAYDGARSNRWEWERIGPVTLDGDHDYRLNLWVGGLGFCLDKIVITKDSSCGTRACDRNQEKGPDQTQGRTREACNPCDPRYGQNIPAGTISWDPDGCNTTGDDLWDDEQPIRASKEAVKRFVDRLDPEMDQVSYVYYSSTDDTGIGSQLYCLRKLGDNCNDFDEVLDAIEDTEAGGSTAMANGMYLGIETLRTDFTDQQCKNHNKPCGRGAAAHIMVLMTDGVANAYSSSYCSGATSDLWPDGDMAKDCVVYQAMRARDKGIIIYAISLGMGADFALMQRVADLTKGEHFQAVDTEALDGVFDQIFDRIFLRLLR